MRNTENIVHIIYEGLFLVNIDKIVEVRRGFNTDILNKASKNYTFREKVSVSSIRCVNI